MSNASTKPARPPALDRGGNHWETHGRAVYHRDSLAAQVAPGVSAHSYRKKAERMGKATVLMDVSGCGPLAMFLHLSPTDAEDLASNLQAAAKRAREVDAVVGGAL